MPFVNIRIVKEVIEDDPEGKKAAMALRISEAIAEVAGVSRDAVWVVVEEIPETDWFVGKDRVKELRAGS